MSRVLVVYDVNKAGGMREGAGMTRNGRPPSMADVAELVGVSHHVVSHVVNGNALFYPHERAWAGSIGTSRASVRRR